MEKNVISKEVAEKICKEVFSVAEFCRAVGWKPTGGNYRTFYKYVKEYGLDYSHFTGQRSNLGNKHQCGLPSNEFFVKEKLIKSSDVIKKLIALGLKEYRCENPECGISEWHGKEIRLQLHHKDGDHFNNELDNLMLLCPNCHSQTDTFAGKKNKKGVSTTKHTKEPKHKCSVCGKALHTEPKTGMCKTCLLDSKKKEHLDGNV